MIPRCATASRRKFLQAGAVTMIGGGHGAGRVMASGMAQSGMTWPVSWAPGKSQRKSAVQTADGTKYPTTC
jgi:hypothetical protein